MGNKDINIRIAVENLTKGAFRLLGKGLKNIKSLAVNATRSLGRLTARAVRGFRNMALAAGTGIAAFGVFAVKAAGDAEETRSKFNAVFKELADAARQWASDFGNSVNRASIDIEKMLAAVQDLFVPLGFARKQAAAFAKEIVKLAVDIASFNNKADADVLRDIQSALVGNSETVRKYGIVLTEANIAQEAYAEGFSKTRKNISNAAKVQARMSLIIKGSTDAQGDAVRTAGSFANVMKGLQSRFKGFRIEVGSQIIKGLELSRNFKALTDRVKAFTDRLRETKAIEKFAGTFIERLQPVKELISDLFEGGEARTQAISRLQETGKTIAQSIGDYLSEKGPMIGEKIAIGLIKGTGKAITGGAKGIVKSAVSQDVKLASLQAGGGNISTLERAFPVASNIISGGAFAGKVRTEELLRDIREEIKALKAE